MSVDVKLPLINSAWNQSFVREDKNTNAGADRGWNPLNYILLTLPEIRATMTEEEVDAEKSSSSIIMRREPLCPIDGTPTVPDLIDGTLTPTLSVHTPMPLLNYNRGQAAFCVNALLQHNQLMSVRHRIKRERDNGKSLRVKIETSKRVTEVMLVKAVIH